MVSSVKIDLTGRTALVTGGARGIGAAVVDQLYEAGAFVIGTGTNIADIEKLNSHSPPNKQYLAVDFLDESSISSFLTSLKNYNRIDILVNNAGVNRIAVNTETTDEDYDFIMNVNLKGPYLLLREISKKMKANHYGRIVNITSIWSEVTRSGRSLYTASKYALSGLSKTLAVEMAADNVLVNSVGPGFTLTELTESTNTVEELNNIASVIPAQRLAAPIEIANLVLFLSSNLNTYITGQNIIIDGGYTNV